MASGNDSSEQEAISKHYLSQNIETADLGHTVTVVVDAVPMTTAAADVVVDVAANEAFLSGNTKTVEHVDSIGIESVASAQIPPPKKRGRPPRKIKTAGEDDEWRERKNEISLTNREAVVTRTRTGRTSRRSIYGDDFVSPFDTKTIKAELDRAEKIKNTGTDTPKRGRGRPPLKSVPAPKSVIKSESPEKISTLQDVEADRTTQTTLPDMLGSVVPESTSTPSEGVPQETMMTPTEDDSKGRVTDGDVLVETPSEVVPVPKKRGKGRPPKKKEANPKYEEIPDADLLEEVEDDSLEAITEEEQGLLDFLEMNGEDDFKEWSGNDVLAALDTESEGSDEVIPVDQSKRIRHLSATADITDLLPERCSSFTDCRCGLFHCPLCTVEYFKPVSYFRVISKHLSIHEKYGVKFLDVICCPCRLDCRDVKSPHFHCPACGDVKLTKTVFERHLEKHSDVTYVLDAQWRTRPKKPANRIPIPKKVPTPTLDEPVLSNVTAVLTTEFLEHIGATEDTENFLREKLAMEKVYITKVADQWIIHGQWEHIQKAYSRLKKLHKEAKIQKMRDQKSSEGEEVHSLDAEGELLDASGESNSVVGHDLTIPEQEGTETISAVTASEETPTVSDVGQDDTMQAENTAEENETDPDYKPRQSRRSKDQIKALGIRLKCRVCGLIKHSKDSLYRHIWRCHKEKNHICRVCGRGFGQRSDMTRHQDKCKGQKLQLPEPEGDGPYKCDLCDKVLQTRETLKAHHKYIHTESGACVCHLCGKNFRAPRYLKSHLVRHSDLRTYICGICGKGFKERGTLKEHLGTHKDMSERVKKYKCELCPKSYFRHTALMDHMNFHTGQKPHVCAECGRAFIGRCALIKHQMSHADDKTYECDRCGKKFKFKHKLDAHFVTHTGFSKHVCDICGKCFTTSTTLRKHSCKGTLQVDKMMLPDETAPPVDTGKQTVQLYMCSLCNLTFTEWTEVASHMLLHNEVSEGGVENGADATVQIELQSQDLINLADAAASASLAASADVNQTEDMQSVINAIAQVQQMETAEAELDEATSEAQRALAQIQYDKIQIQDSNIVSVTQGLQGEPHQVTIHLEDEDQFQMVQEQLATNPEQFQIIQEGGVDGQGEFQVIQEVGQDPDGQFQVIQDVDEQVDNPVAEDDGMNQTSFRIIQGDPGTRGQFRILHSEATGQFRVIHGDPLGEGSFQVIQDADDPSQYQVIQEAQADGDFDMVHEITDVNQFHVVPGSETADGTIKTMPAETSERSMINIGDISIDQLTAVTRIAMETETANEHQGEILLEPETANEDQGEILMVQDGHPIYDAVQSEALVGNTEPVVESEAQMETY